MKMVTRLSKGLAEISGSNKGRPSSRDCNVHLIHQSVQDYLLQGGLAQLDPTISSFVEALSNQYLLDTCFKYLHFREVQHDCHHNTDRVKTKVSLPRVRTSPLGSSFEARTARWAHFIFLSEGYADPSQYQQRKLRTLTRESIPNLGVDHGILDPMNPNTFHKRQPKH